MIEAQNEAPSASVTGQKLVAKPRFRSDIEGLRAIAILLVVFYHAGIPGFSGGYIGVDVFFVISGYLITWLLIHEIETTGTIQLFRFYARRARRLLPAVSLMLLVTAAVSAFLYAPFEQFDLAKTALTTATYRSNIYFAQAAVNYLGADIKANPLLHTWSLSVEEQFYLVWPLLVMLVSGVLLKQKKTLSYRQILLWMIVISATSFAVSLHLSEVRQSSAFFLSHARAWEFSIGALGLLIPHSTQKKYPKSRAKTLSARVINFAVNRETLGWLGLAGILGTTIGFNETTPFPGVVVLIPTVSTVLVLRSCDAKNVGSESETKAETQAQAQSETQSGTQSGTWIARALSWKVFQEIGRISYSWYLWHWPILVLAGTLTKEVPLAIRIGLLLLSLIPAIASYKLVENPIRRNAFLGKHSAYSIALAVILAIAGSYFALEWTQMAGRWSQQPEQALYTVVRDDNASVYNTSCHGDLFLETPDIEDCTVVGGSGDLKVVLLGDSHAAQWYDVLADLALSNSWAFTSMTKVACPYVDILTYRPEVGKYTACVNWRQHAVEYIQKAKPDLVIVSTLTQSNVYPFSPAEWTNGADRTISALSAASKKVVILRDPPDPGFDVPTCLARNQWWRHHTRFQRTCELSGDEVPGQIAYAAQQEAAQRYKNVFTVDMNPYICKNRDCDLKRGNIVVYRDDNHLSVTFTKTLAPALDQQLSDVLNQRDS